jgi:ribosome-associated translation inhibitor RaiA
MNEVTSYIRKHYEEFTLETEMVNSQELKDIFNTIDEVLVSAERRLTKLKNNDNKTLGQK